MRAAIIENGVVVNIAEATPEFAATKGWIASNTAAPGDLYANSVFSAPAPLPPVVPQIVSMRQAQLALYGAGLLPNVNTAIAGMTGTAGDMARIEWSKSGFVSRTQPLVLALAPTLGLTSAQLDALFIAAATFL